MNNSQKSIEHYLSIKLENELFAISVHKVLEVLESQKVTVIPNMPDMIRGVINFRGEILPVIDARIKFNMEDRKPDQKHVIIVLELTSPDKKLMLGIIADSVKDVLEISENDIKTIPEMGIKYNAEFLHGMVRLDDGFIMLLDVDKVFSSDELIVLNNTVLENEVS